MKYRITMEVDVPEADWVTNWLKKRTWYALMAERHLYNGYEKPKPENVDDILKWMIQSIRVEAVQ